MAFSKVDICNKALNYLGQKPIASLTENTPQAIRLNYIYDTVRDELLRSFDWGFARRIETLNSISGETVPGWLYLYLYPPKCMRIKKVFQDTTSEDPLTFTYKEVLSPLSAVKAIAANITPAYAEYTFQVDDTSVYDADFIEAFARKLAAETAFVLTGNLELGPAMLAAFKESISEAKRISGHERQANAPRSSSFEDARS